MEWFWDLLPILIVQVPVAVFWILFRNKATPLESAPEIDRWIDNGKPTVMRFFKNT